MRKWSFSRIIIMAILTTSLLGLAYSGFPNDNQNRLVTIIIYITVFDCEHGNPIPNAKVTISEPVAESISKPFTESIIESTTTDTEGKRIIWYTAYLEVGENEDPEILGTQKALNTIVEIEKPGSECFAREVDSYLVISTDFEVIVEKDFCMKGCYKNWRPYKNIKIPENALNKCTGLLKMTHSGECTAGDVGKRISPICSISWSQGRTKWKRECALICSGGYGYQNQVDLRCSEPFKSDQSE